MSRITSLIILFSVLLTFLIIGCQKRLDKATLDLGETLSPKSTTNTNKTITGQGAFIDFDVRGTYTTNGSKTYEYNKVLAESFFTHNNGVYTDVSPFTKLSGSAGETKKTSAKMAVLPQNIIDQYLNGVTPTTPTSNTTSYSSSTPCTPADPGAPNAPSKDLTKMATVIDNNACVFLNGGTLGDMNYTKTTNSGTVSCVYVSKVYYVYNPSGSRGWYIDSNTVNGTYAYTYNYSITANEGTKNVSPQTAWDQVAFNLGDGPTIPVSAFLSRLQANSQQTSTGTVDPSLAKYTFNLESQVIDPLTNTTSWVSNISNIQISVTDTFGNIINGQDGAPLVINNPPHYIESNYNPETPLVLPKKDETGACDFKFSALAGSNLTSGTSIQLFDFNKNGRIDSADITDARTLLNSDGFANNQDGGALGKALQKARMPAQPVRFPGTLTGVFIIRISATLAGLTSTASQTITHDQKINIIANCNGNL